MPDRFPAKSHQKTNTGKLSVCAKWNVRLLAEAPIPVYNFCFRSKLLWQCGLMAWRIDEQLIRGEIDNTVRGRVTGKLWFHGLAEPVVLNLSGNCAPDLAGCVLTFENPKPPVSGDLSGFQLEQNGWTGSITASQKCKVHDVPMEEVMRLYKLKQPAPWHWANTLYLEWNSQLNGPIVIQSADYILKISEPAWTLSEEEYQQSQEATARDYLQWMEENLTPANSDEPVFEEDQDGEGEEWKRDKE